MIFSDYNKSFSVSAPPASEVVDGNQLDRVLSIGCFVVDPAMRRRGVARALVQGAIDVGPSWGARFLEAYPRRSDHALHDGEAWTGPERVFAELGFEVARDALQYPVLRRAFGVR